MSPFPVLAVVDKQPGQMVIWHVQTSPDSPGVLSGAWITAKEGSLLDNTFTLTAGSAAVESIADAVEAEVDRVRRGAKRAKETAPSITLPRFADVPRPDLKAIAETFRGEDSARDAWATAVGLAEIAEYWHGFESARKMRKYLAEEFGAEIRPLPVSRDLNT